MNELEAEPSRYDSDLLYRIQNCCLTHVERAPDVESLIVLIDDCHSFTISNNVIKDCWPLFEWQRKLKLVIREKGRIKIRNIDAQVFAKFLDFAIKCATKLNSGNLHTIALVADDGAVSRLLGKSYFDGSDLNLHTAEQMLDKFLLGTGLPNFDRSTIVENYRTYDFASEFHIHCLRVLAFLHIRVQLCSSAAQLKSSYIRSEKMYSPFSDVTEYFAEARRARELITELQAELHTADDSQQTRKPIYNLMLTFKAFCDGL